MPAVVAKVRKLAGVLGPCVSRGAGRHVGRRGQLGRRGAPGRAGLRRRRRHDEAVLLRRRRPRPALLLARLDQRRAGRGAQARHSALRPQPRGPLQPARHPELRERVQPGRTPIPCVRCNSFTKFRDLLAHADALDCDYIATGHYAVARDGGALPGQRSAPRTRATSSGASTARSWPACSRRSGELTKAETRALARRLGLVTADKPESVEICFVPDDDYVAVLERHLPADAPALAPGPLVTTGGRGDRRARGLSPATPSASGRASRAASPSRGSWWPSGRSAARS